MVAPPSGAGRRPVRDRLLRLGFMQRALAGEADLSLFRKRPTAKLAAGVFCIGISYVIAWPLMTVLAVVSTWMGRPWIGVVGAPILYGMSWVVWTGGLWMAGSDSVKYGRAFGTWALQRFAHRFLLP